MDNNKISKTHTAVLDLDNTLIDTEKIKAYLDRIALKHGLDHDEAQVVYQSSRDKDGKVMFDLNMYLGNLKKVLAQNGKKFSQEIFDGTVETMFADPELLLPGAKELLESCAQEKLKIMILSLGVTNWQEQKIKFSGLGKLLETIEDKYGIKIDKKYTVEENGLKNQDKGSTVERNDDELDEIVTGKQKAMLELFGAKFDGTGVVLFNDKPDETAMLLEKFPGLQAYVRRSISDLRYQDVDFERLKEKFGFRVECSQDLVTLKKILDKKLIKEYEPRTEDHR